LCLGGDLVIIGMSLADEYLRQAIVRYRRWMRRILWFGNERLHDEWARVAGVTFVEAPHQTVWKGLAARFIERDPSGALRAHADKMREDLPSDLRRLIGRFSEIPAHLESHAQTILRQSPPLGPAKVVQFAQLCVDMGCDIPGSIVSDPRCRF
jgi:hypothetical protein